MTNFVRRATATLSIAVGLAAASFALAGPAGASVPQGWSDPAPMPTGKFLLIILVLPVAASIVIALIVLLPGLLKGEGLGNKPVAGGEWFGGPRQGTAELAEPDGEDSQAGGASARW